jgi:hypothetical protein
MPQKTSGKRDEPTDTTSPFHFPDHHVLQHGIMKPKAHRPY